MNTTALGAPHGAEPGTRGAESDEQSGTPLARSMVLSAVLHAAVVATFALWQTSPPPERPPVYKVNIVGALQGPKAIGVVDPRPATTPTRAADAPSGIERPELPAPTVSETQSPPKPAPPQATPIPSRTAQAGQPQEAPKPAPATSAPRAGSTDGGRGADVATVRTDGIDFPVPGYINNIQRQVVLRFNPDARLRNRGLVAEVSFLIQRDGRVTDIRVEQTSGMYSFDLEARSAIEAAGSAKAFGPLPSEWTDDVLRVYYNFKPEGSP